MKTKIKKIERAAEIIGKSSLVFFLSGVFSMLFAIPLARFGVASWVSVSMIYYFALSFIVAVGLFVVCDHLTDRASNLREAERRAEWNKKHPDFI